MLTATKTYGRLALIAVASLWLLYVAVGSDSFQICTADKENKQPKQTADKNSSKVLRSLVESASIKTDCVFVFLYESRDAITAIATAFISIFTFTLWRSTDRLWEAGEKEIAVTNAGIEIAKNAHIAEHRTWLKIYPTEIGPVTFDGDRIRVNITVEAENIGGSPALQVNLRCKPYRGRGFMASGSTVKSLLAEEKHFASVTKSGMILMIGEKTSCRFSADAETDAVTEAKTEEQEAFGIPPANLKVTLSVACCVIYKSMASDDWHHTGHIIWLRKKDRSRFDASLGDVAGDNIKVTMPQSESSVA